MDLKLLFWFHFQWNIQTKMVYKTSNEYTSFHIYQLHGRFIFFSQCLQCSLFIFFPSKGPNKGNFVIFFLSRKRSISVNIVIKLDDFSDMQQISTWDTLLAEVNGLNDPWAWAPSHLKDDIGEPGKLITEVSLSWISPPTAKDRKRDTSFWKIKLHSKSHIW